MRALLTALGILAVAGTIVHGATPRTMASSPCQSIMGDPPISDPIELVAGRIIDAGNGNVGIPGATVAAFRCSSGSGVSQGTTQTESDGSYSFTLSGGHYYYVQALLTGPLAGMTPFGTVNPSAAMALGDSVDDVDLAFQ